MPQEVLTQLVGKKSAPLSAPVSIENGMPLGELAQFVQGKEEDE